MSHNCQWILIAYAPHWQKLSLLFSHLNYILPVHLHCLQKVSPQGLHLCDGTDLFMGKPTQIPCSLCTSHTVSGRWNWSTLTFHIGWIAERESSGMPHWTTVFPYNFQICLRKARTRGTQRYVETSTIESGVSAHENLLVADYEGSSNPWHCNNQRYLGKRNNESHSSNCTLIHDWSCIVR